MIFNSIEFPIFFIAATALFFAVPEKLRNAVLLIASYVFYLWWNVRLAFLIVFVTLISYLSGILCEKYPQKRKTFAGISVSLILGVLVFFKYYNFLAGSVSALIGAFGGGSYDFSLDILLPIGISFYTFQTLSYVVDTSSGKLRPEKNFFIYALFVSFYPQLVAGPIERPENLIPQFREKHVFDPQNVVSGLKLMLIGFFEKIAVADVAGIFVNAVFENVRGADGALVFSASLLFSVQILCDFKGYTDIARGCALVYGIRLSENFDKPYAAISVREFWRRWHVTLSSWLRDYVYIPLGGSRRSFLRTCLNVLVVFLVSGLWHGADWTFVIWGLIHAFLQIAEMLYEKYKTPKDHGIFRVLRVSVTFIFVTLSWIFFRADTVFDAFFAFKSLFGGFDPASLSISNLAAIAGVSLPVFLAGAIILAFYLIASILLPKVQKKPVRHVIYAFMLLMTAVAFIYFESGDVPSSFIYFQF